MAENIESKSESAVISIATSSIKALSLAEIYSLHPRDPTPDEQAKLHDILAVYNRMLCIVSKMDFTIQIEIVAGNLTDPPPRCWTIPNFLGGYMDMSLRPLNVDEEFWIEELVDHFKEFVERTQRISPPLRLRVSFPLSQEASELKHGTQRRDYRKSQEF